MAAQNGPTWEDHAGESPHGIPCKGWKNGIPCGIGSGMTYGLGVGRWAVATVKLVPEDDPNPLVQEVFRDIKETKEIDFVPNIWRALATHPPHLHACWTRLKAIMGPGKLDLLTKEIIALAVSVTNGCPYWINSHTAAVQRLGLDREGYSEVLAVIGLFNQMNRLADAYQLEPDVLPELF
jgi:AhpD family alkylhydroperoxidase